MIDKDAILRSIKDSVNTTEPGATIILYGSYARGDFNEGSDIDVLILIDKDKVTRSDRMRIGYPLHDIELRENVVISPMIRPRNAWENEYKITPLYHNIKLDGVIL